MKIPALHKKKVGRIHKNSYSQLFDLSVSKKKRHRKKILGSTLSYLIRIISIIQKKLFGYILLGIGVSCIITIIWLFRVETILISRDNSFIDINQAYRSSEYLRGKHMFMISGSDITERIQRSQEAVKSVRITRRFPSTLVMELRSHEILFQTTGSLILKNGLILPFDSGAFGDLPFLELKQKEGIQLEKSDFLSVEDLESITFLLEYLQKNILALEVSAMIYYEREKELHLVDANNTLYLFDLTGNLSLQGEKLAVYWKERPGSLTNGALRYIDVRIPQRLFLCSREQEKSCENTLRQLYGDDILSVNADG